MTAAETDDIEINIKIIQSSIRKTLSYINKLDTEDYQNATIIKELYIKIQEQEEQLEEYIKEYPEYFV